MLRQPSSSRFSPSAWMISGLIKTILASGFFPAVTSTTAMRIFLPICGAARPTPCAAYMLANMSSASSASSASNLVMGLVDFSRMGSPYFTILWILRSGSGGGTSLEEADAPVAGAVVACSAGGSLTVVADLELGDLLGIVVEVAAHLG